MNILHCYIKLGNMQKKIVVMMTTTGDDDNCASKG